MDGKRIANLFYVLVLILLVAGMVFGASSDTLDRISDVFLRYVLVPGVLSTVAGAFVGSIFGDTLKGIPLLTLNFSAFGFSFTAFLTVHALAVLVVRYVLF